MSLTCIFDPVPPYRMKGPKSLFRSPLQVILTLFNRSNKVKQSRTGSNKVEQVISTLFHQSRLCSPMNKVEQSQTRSNKVEQGRTSNIDFFPTRSTLFESEQSRTKLNKVEHGQTRANKVEQGRTESISLVGGPLFVKNPYLSLCKMPIMAILGHLKVVRPLYIVDSFSVYFKN